jgi:hypothetical protein
MRTVRITGYRPHTQGKLPIDERCQCGRLKSQHSPKVQRRGKTVIVEPGHGDGVECTEFRFKEFVYDETDPRPPAQGWKP